MSVMCSVRSEKLEHSLSSVHLQGTVFSTSRSALSIAAFLSSRVMSTLWAATLKHSLAAGRLGRMQHQPASNCFSRDMPSWALLFCCCHLSTLSSLLCSSACTVNRQNYWRLLFLLMLLLRDGLGNLIQENYNAISLIFVASCHEHSHANSRTLPECCCNWGDDDQHWLTCLWPQHGCTCQ